MLPGCDRNEGFEKIAFGPRARLALGCFEATERSFKGREGSFSALVHNWAFHLRWI
jgi:hypothetical protein